MRSNNSNRIKERKYENKKNILEFSGRLEHCKHTN